MNTKTFAKIDLKQKPNKREKTIFFVALCLIFAVFLKQCAWPSYVTLNATQEQFKELRNQRVELESLTTPQVVTNLPVQKQWVGTSKEDLDNAIDEITESLYLQRVKILKIQFSDLAKKQNMSTRDVTLTLKGGFEAIGQYIEHLENMHAPLVIKSISLQPDGDDPSNIVVNLSGGVYAAY
jgi:hypothetical protein